MLSYDIGCRNSLLTTQLYSPLQFNISNTLVLIWDKDMLQKFSLLIRLYRIIAIILVVGLIYLVLIIKLFCYK